MSLKRYATRRDGTETAILAALRKAGADYLLLDAFDVLVLFRGGLTMLDCKSLSGKKTRSQEILVERGWPVYFVTTPQEALTAIGAMKS